MGGEKLIFLQPLEYTTFEKVLKNLTADFFFGLSPKF